MSILSQLLNKNGEKIDPINHNYESRLQKLENNIYSTSEVKTGQNWINDKPIYRKCFVIDKDDTSSSSITIETGIQNLELITNIRGLLLRTEGTMMNIPNGLITNTDWLLWFGDLTATQIKVKMGASAYGIMSKVYVVLEYTKTTDS